MNRSRGKDRIWKLTKARRHTGDAIRAPPQLTDETTDTRECTTTAKDGGPTGRRHDRRHDVRHEGGHDNGGNRMK